MKTSTLLISIAFIGFILRRTFMPGIAFIEWEEWLVICTAVATAGYLLVDWKRSRATESDIADLYYKVGGLESQATSGDLLESRISDLHAEVTVLRHIVDEWEEVDTETDDETE